MIAFLERARRFIGLPASSQHASEQIVATLGGTVAIIAILVVTRLVVGASGAVIIVPSMGASTVLVFAVPHGALSQPWAVFGGNVLSALAGVTCFLVIPDQTVAAGAAVGLAIGAMHVGRCIHPPGGATALAAVIGGPAIHQLGYGFALLPVALNCLILLVVGVAFNSVLAWRRYPASLMRYAHAPPRSGRPQITTQQVNAALERIGVVVDVSPDELKELIDDVIETADRDEPARLPEVKVGRFYCNDRPGQPWSVRQVIAEQRSDDPAHDLVTYKVVDGSDLHRTQSCTRIEFATWVKSELHPRR